MPGVLAPSNGVGAALVFPLKRWGNFWQKINSLNINRFIFQKSEKNGPFVIHYRLPEKLQLQKPITLSPAGLAIPTGFDTFQAF